MLHIIGLGLNEKGISIEGNETLKKCKKVYLENLFNTIVCSTLLQTYTNFQLLTPIRS